MAVWDCFIYCGETEVLAIRMAELAAAVDVFVIVEAAHTFQGEPRELTHPDLPGEVVRVDITEPLPADTWAAEEYVRNAIRRGLYGAAADDLVLISDVDEIPRASVLPKLEGHPLIEGRGAVALENTSYYYTLDWQVPWRHEYHPVAIRADGLRSPQAARTQPMGHFGGGPHAPDPTAGNAGWHFSWLGNATLAMQKLHAFAHREYRALGRPHVEACIRDGIDLFGRGPLLPVEIDETYPACIRDDPARWAHLLRPRETHAPVG